MLYKLPIMIKHIVCYSGGHSSALTAIEVVRKYSSNNIVLLNHNINPKFEHSDIKRFKQEVADYLGLQITYANCLDISQPERLPSQFQVCMIAKAFKVGDGMPLCTNRLKTAPFYNWLDSNCAPGQGIIYYGFNSSEADRIIRRRKFLEAKGYSTCYPLAEWKRTIKSTVEVGIEPPCTYAQFKHANCLGCLRAGKQHWYVVYCTQPDIWEEAKKAESYIGYTILPGESLESIEPLFEAMKTACITPSEHIPHQRFWADVARLVKSRQREQYCQPTIFMPCECST